MKTLTLNPTKSALLLNVEKRYIAAQAGYDFNPCPESLERLESVAFTLVKIKKQYGAEISDELADIVERSKKRNAPNVETWTSPNTEFDSYLVTFDRFMMTAIMIVGSSVLAATVYGLFNLFEWFQQR